MKDKSFTIANKSQNTYKNAPKGQTYPKFGPKHNKARKIDKNTTKVKIAKNR